jgi:hypothetical protein
MNGIGAPHHSLSQHRVRNGGRFKKQVGRLAVPSKEERLQRAKDELKLANADIDRKQNELATIDGKHRRSLLAMESKHAADIAELEKKHDDLLASAHQDLALAEELAASRLQIANLTRDLNTVTGKLAAAQNDMAALESTIDAAATRRQQQAVKLMGVTKQWRQQRSLASTLRTQVATKDAQVLRHKQKVFECVDFAKELQQKLDEIEDNKPLATMTDDDSPLPPHPSPPGGPPVAAGGPPVAPNRPARGKLDDRRNVGRWTKDAFARLSHYDPGRLAATVANMHSELMLKNKKLAKYIGQMDVKELLSILPATSRAKLREEGAKAFRDAMQEHWSVLVSSSIKFNATLSRKKFEVLRRSLSCAWDKTEAAWKHCEFEGIAFPKLATRYKIDKFVNEVKKEVGLDSFADGLGASVDPNVLLAANAMDSANNGYFKIEKFSTMSFSTTTAVTPRSFSWRTLPTRTRG